MDKRKRKLIIQAIPNPKVVPLNSSLEEMKKKNLSLTEKYIGKGFSTSEAIYKASGMQPKFNVDEALKNKKKKLKFAAIPLVVIVGMAAAVPFVKSQVSPQQTDALSDVSSNEESEDPSVGHDRMILLAGTDERGDEAVSNEGTSADVPGVRTDVLSLVSIPDDGSRAIAVSLPRDLMVDRPECQLYDVNSESYLDANEPSQNNVKINSIYQQGGPKCLVKTVEESVGTSINGYAEVGFSTFADVVDNLGGINIDSDTPIIDETLGEIIPEAGKSKLDGKTALDYVRARKVQGSSMSDFDRINRQQEFMSALLSKLKDKANTGNIEKFTFASNLVKDVLPEMKVDGLDADDAISILRSILVMDSEAIRMTTIPITENSVNSNDLFMDEDKVEKLIYNLENNVPMHGDKPKGIDEENSLMAKQSRLSDSTILIAARSQYDSRAKQLQERLSKSGANVSIVESPFVPEESTIIADEQNKNYTSTLAAMYPGSHISTEVFDSSLPMQNGTSVVSIGDDFKEAYNLSNSVDIGAEVYIPKDDTVQSSNIVPEKLPQIPGHQVISGIR